MVEEKLPCPEPEKPPCCTRRCVDICCCPPGCTCKDPCPVPSVTDSFEVESCYEFRGQLAKWIVAQQLPWEYIVKAESLGPEPEVVACTAKGVTVPGQLIYRPKCTVQPNTLVANGVYKLLCTFVLPGTGLSNFCEGPVINVTE